MYGATNDKNRIKESSARLETLYNRIPDTKGCMDHIDKSEADGGCGAWCCKTQNPQVLYSEFLNTWSMITSTWEDSKIESLVEKCLRRYLFSDKYKGCSFLDTDTNKCSQHSTRPFNCRTYGIIPEEEFKPRYERLKVLYPDSRNQCNLVSTVNGEAVTKRDMDSWWLEMNAIEMSLGIKKDLVTDAPGGSYRTYHDHILIHLLGEKGMQDLSELREKGEDKWKNFAIKNILIAMKKFRIKEKMNGNSEERDASSPSSEDPGL